MTKIPTPTPLPVVASEEWTLQELKKHKFYLVDKLDEYLNAPRIKATEKLAVLIGYTTEGKIVTVEVEDLP